MRVDGTDLITTAHAALGSAVIVLGGYLILVAATRVVPVRLRFERYRPWNVVDRDSCWRLDISRRGVMEMRLKYLPKIDLPWCDGPPGQPGRGACR